MTGISTDPQSERDAHTPSKGPVDSRDCDSERMEEQEYSSFRAVLTALRRHWPALGLTLAVLAFAVAAPAWLPAWLAVLLTAVVWAASVTWKALSQDTRKKREAAQTPLSASHSDKDILDLALEIDALIAPEIAELQALISQASQVVAHAVEDLQRSFATLGETISEQQKLVLHLLRGLAADEAAQDLPTMNSLIDESSRVLSGNLRTLAEMGDHSEHLSRKVDGLAVPLRRLFDMVDNARPIAPQANLSELNAAVEAAIAGEAGNGFALVVQQIRKLSDSSDAFTTQIVLEVAQASTILAEIREIVGCMVTHDVSAVAAAKGTLDSMMAQVQKVNTRVSEGLDELSGVSGRVRDNVNAAVRLLQFEDITRQVLERAAMRMSVLESFAEELRRTPLTEFESPRARLDRAREQLQTPRGEFRDAAHRPVRQTSMTEGEIDLF